MTLQTYPTWQSEIPSEVLERGAWRSSEIFECEYCGAQSNRWTLGGWTTRGPRLVCPGSECEEHEILVDAQSAGRKQAALATLLQAVNGDAPSPTPDLGPIKELFRRTCSDLEGVRPDAPVHVIEPSFYAHPDRSILEGR